MSFESEHMWGDGMPKGNKKAGYVGLMVAKAQGKKRKDYDPEPRRKQIGKFNVNKLSNPSANLKLMFINQLKEAVERKKDRSKVAVSPSASWDAIKAKFPDRKTAVQEFRKANPTISQRDITHFTGVPQPTVNRYLKAIGSGKEDELTKTEAGMRSRLMNTTSPHITNIQLTAMRGHNIKDLKESASNLHGDIPKTDSEKIQSLVSLGEEWARVRDNSMKEINRIMNLMSSEDCPQLLGNELEEDPESKASMRYFAENPVTECDRLAVELYEYKRDFFKCFYIIGQINRAIVRIALHTKLTEDPSAYTEGDSNMLLRPEVSNPTRMISEILSKPLETGRNYIAKENAGEPSQRNYVVDESGEEMTGNGINISKKDFTKEHKHLVGLLRKSCDKKFLKEALDQSMELQQKTGVNLNKKPVHCGSGKPVKRLYSQNGKIYRGKYHIMDDGNVHSGVKHTARSKLLVVK